MVGALVLRAGGGFALATTATIAAGAGLGFVLGGLVVGWLVRLALALVAAIAVALLWPTSDGAGRSLGGVVTFAAALLATRRLHLPLPLSPFLVTLGLWGALRGLAKGLGQNQPIYFPSDTTLASLMLPGSLGLPPGVWILLLVAAVAGFALTRSVFGRHVMALGSNRETARLCGIDVVRTELLVYVLGGAAAGLAAVLQLSYLSMGDPTTAQGLELKAIAAAVIGGASLQGGQASILGTLLGAFVMTVVDNGCTKLGLDNWVQEVVTGAIIVAAVALDRWRQRLG
jgi:ribose/xylose/arabinose/galactoside ABC-type transport system permease subunit